MICIYCGDEKPGDDRSVEHVIPQSFGTFSAETPTLSCVCCKCNQLFANGIDAALARESLEGIQRYRKGLFSSEERPQQRIEIRLPPGLGDFSGAYAWIDGTTGKLRVVRSQVRFSHSDGTYEFVLKERLRQFDWRAAGLSTENFKTYAESKQELEQLIEILRDIGIPYDEVKMKPTGFQRRSLTVQIQGDNRVTGRAIAKILLNLCAFYLGPEEVRKPQWDAAKQYVMVPGSPRIPGRMTDSPFWPGERGRLRLPNVGYNLRLRNQDGNVVGAAQFFNLFLNEFIVAQNHALPGKIEKRFVNGQVPVDGSRINYSIMMLHRLDFDLERFEPNQ